MGEFPRRPRDGGCSRRSSSASRSGKWGRAKTALAQLDRGLDISLTILRRWQRSEAAAATAVTWFPPASSARPPAGPGARAAAGREQMDVAILKAARDIVRTVGGCAKDPGGDGAPRGPLRIARQTAYHRPGPIDGALCQLDGTPSLEGDPQRQRHPGRVTRVRPRSRRQPRPPTLPVPRRAEQARPAAAADERHQRRALRSEALAQVLAVGSVAVGPAARSQRDAHYGHPERRGKAATAP